MSEKFKDISFKEYKDIPYTVVGNTSLPQNLGITLMAEGLKKILKKSKHKDDMLSISVGEDGHKFTLHKFRK